MYVCTHAEDMNLYYMHVSMHMYIQVCVPLPCTPEVCLMRTWLGAARALQSRATQSTDGRAQQLQEQRVREQKWEPDGTRRKGGGWVGMMLVL